VTILVNMTLNMCQLLAVGLIIPVIVY